jgi:hypothetical protein
MKALPVLALAVAAAAIGAWALLGTDGPEQAPAATHEARVGEPEAGGRVAPAPVRDDLPPAPGSVPERLPEASVAPWTVAPPPAHAFAPGAIVGRLVDAAGAAVPRLEIRLVEASARQDTPAARPVAREVTDAEGRFRIGGVPPGEELMLEARHGLHGALGLNCVRSPEGVTLDLGDVALAAPARCEGRVIAPDGAPLAGVELFAPGSSDRSRELEADLMLLPGELRHAAIHAASASVTARRGVTDADGRFAFSAIEPTSVSARLAGRATGIAGWSPWATEPLEIMLPPAGQGLAGVVRRDGGGPLPARTQVLVLASASGAREIEPLLLRPGADGRFACEGLADIPHDVVLLAPGHDPVFERGVIGGRRDLELVLAAACPAEVRATAGGAPVDAFDLWWRDAPLVAGARAAATPWQHGRSRPEGGGVLRLEGAASGPCLAQATAPDGRCSEVVRLDVSNGCPPRQLVLAIGPRREVRGRVVAAGGSPVTDALLTARLQDGTSLPLGATRSGSDGSFTLTFLPPGVLRLAAERPGFLPQSLRVEADAGLLSPVQLQRSAAVQVRVGPVLRAALAGEARRLPQTLLVQLTGAAGPDSADMAIAGAAGAFFADTTPGVLLLSLRDAAEAEPLEITAIAGELTVVEY